MQPWLLATSFIPPFQAEFGTIQRPNAWIVEILAPQTKDEECLEWVNEDLAICLSTLFIYCMWISNKYTSIYPNNSKQVQVKKKVKNI